MQVFLLDLLLILLGLTLQRPTDCEQPNQILQTKLLIFQPMFYYI